MSSHRITELIDKVDTSELVRDEIGAILLAESAEQQALATAAGEDPNLWKLRVFLERSNPWSEWIDVPDQGAADAAPIINVRLETVSYDESASNAVERQRAQATYHVDCFGYGVSEDDGEGGHHPGDMRAALEAQRAYRLVRNILMAGHYTYLGMRGTVGRRWPQSVQALQVPLDGRTIHHVSAVRLAFRVDFNEFSPQVQGQPLELISTKVKRTGTGEILLVADYDHAP